MQKLVSLWHDLTMKINCPNCKKSIEWSAEFPYRPFCSERCRLIDLGAWAEGAYAFPLEEPPEDGEIEGDSEDEEPSN